jgi:hypothetical protein
VKLCLIQKLTQNLQQFLHLWQTARSERKRIKLTGKNFQVEQTQNQPKKDIDFSINLISRIGRQRAKKPYLCKLEI